MSDHTIIGIHTTQYIETQSEIVSHLLVSVQLTDNACVGGEMVERGME